MIKEFGIKSCSECCFSHGGHLFAAQSNTMISIFNFFTFDLVATLRYVARTIFQELDSGKSSFRLELSQVQRPPSPSPVSC